MNKRRHTLKAVLGAGVGLALLPDRWSKPIVNSIMLPAHAQTSCSGFTIENLNEAISITVTATQIQGPILVPRLATASFSGNEVSTVGGCRDGNSLTVEVDFSGVIDSANNQITGDLTIIQLCGPDLVCEQISTYVVTQNPINAGSDLGDYDGTVTGTLRCCNDFN